MALRQFNRFSIKLPLIRTFSQIKVDDKDLIAKQIRENQSFLEKYKQIARRYPVPIKYFNILHGKYDFSPAGFRRYFLRKFYDNLVKMSVFEPKRHSILGPDLATAHFVTYRHGKVVFKGSKQIISDTDELPNKYDKNYLLEKIDISGRDFVYEAFENFLLLKHLKELNLSGNIFMDEWICGKLARQFRDSKTLEVIDLSDCKNLKEYAIEPLCRIPSLKKLIIKNTPAAKFEHIELLVLLFNEVNPDCKIIY